MSSHPQIASAFRACRTSGWEHRLTPVSKNLHLQASHLPYPLDIPRFITITSLLFQACRTGIPEMGESGSNALGLTVSFAPITRVTSVSAKSSLISSISSTTKPVSISLAHISGRHTVVRYGGLGEEDIALSWHSSSHGVNSEAHIDAPGAEHVDNFCECVLRFRDSHAVSDNLEMLIMSFQLREDSYNDDVLRIRQCFYGVVDGRLGHLSLNLLGLLGSCDSAEEHVRERSVHRNTLRYVSHAHLFSRHDAPLYTTGSNRSRQSGIPHW